MKSTLKECTFIVASATMNVKYIGEGWNQLKWNMEEQNGKKKTRISFIPIAHGSLIHTKSFFFDCFICGMYVRFYLKSATRDDDAHFTKSINSVGTETVHIMSSSVCITTHKNSSRTYSINELAPRTTTTTPTPTWRSTKTYYRRSDHLIDIPSKIPFISIAHWQPQQKNTDSANVSTEPIARKWSEWFA